MQRLAAILIMTWALMVPVSAYAYIGPGVGAGTIAVVLGILASIVMAFFSIIWYPVKRVMRRRRKKGTDHPESGEGSIEESGRESLEEPVQGPGSADGVPKPENPTTRDGA